MIDFKYGRRFLPGFFPTQKNWNESAPANDNFSAIYAGPSLSGYTVYDNRPGYMSILGFCTEQQALEFCAKVNGERDD